MAHNRSPSKIRADVLGSPLSIYSGWFLEVDCGGSCPRGRLYRVHSLARAHGDRTVGDVVRRFRCQVCSAGAITVVLSEAFGAAAGAAGRTGVRLLTRWTVARPDGTHWSRTFTTEAAAWRAVVGGSNTEREWRAKKAEMVRAEWKVQPAKSEAELRDTR